MGKAVSRKGKSFAVKNAGAKLCHTYLGIVEPGIGCVELLAAAVFVILLGKPRNALKGGKVVHLRSGRCREAVKQGLIDVKHLGGLGNGKYVKTAVGKSALRNEILYVSGKLVLGKVIVKVDQHSFFLELYRHLGISRKYVGHIRCAGIAVCDHVQAFVQLRAGGYGSHIDNDALVLSDRCVKLVDQIIHGGLHIPAIIVPHGDGDGIFRIENRA